MPQSNDPLILSMNKAHIVAWKTKWTFPGNSLTKWSGKLFTHTYKIKKKITEGSKVSALWIGGISLFLGFALHP